MNLQIKHLKRVFLCGFLIILFTLAPVAAQPGSQEDPLVSKKYVDDQIAALEQMIANIPNESPSDIPPALVDYPVQVPPGDAELFEVVFAQSGSAVFFESSTEFILRGGSAFVVTVSDGIVDVTAGADIGNGGEVPYNHLLIVPVGDGRGIHVYNDAYLMIKGGYYFG